MQDGNTSHGLSSVRRVPSDNQSGSGPAQVINLTSEFASASSPFKNESFQNNTAVNKINSDILQLE